MKQNLSFVSNLCKSVSFSAGNFSLYHGQGVGCAKLKNNHSVPTKVHPLFDKINQVFS